MGLRSHKMTQITAYKSLEQGFPTLDPRRDFCGSTEEFQKIKAYLLVKKKLQKSTFFQIYSLDSNSLFYRISSFPRFVKNSTKKKLLNLYPVLSLSFSLPG